MGAAVHIVAASVRCPVGLTAVSAAAAVRAGISRVAYDARFTDSAGKEVRCAQVPGLDERESSAARIASLAADLLRDVALAVAAKVTAIGGLADVPVWLAVPEDRSTFGPPNVAQLERTLRSSMMPPFGRTLNLLAQGHAGAALGLRAAMDRLASGRDDLCVVGGVDSYLDADTLAWLEVERRLACTGTRNGFAPGEGAAAVVLATDSVRRHLRLPSLGRVQEVACTYERRDPTGEVGLLGEGLTEALLLATRDLRLPGEAANDVYADINGERRRTEDWGFALMRASHAMRDGTAYVTPVGSCGDMGAASAPMGCALAVHAWQRGYATGPRALVSATSWAGLRGAVLLERVGA